jgi:hypothetical protein
MAVGAVTPGEELLARDHRVVRDAMVPAFLLWS